MIPKPRVRYCLPARRCGRRAVAQLGSAPDWGSGGRRFKSCQPDRDEGRFSWVKSQVNRPSCFFGHCYASDPSGGFWGPLGGRIPQHRRGDPPASGTGEQASHRVGIRAEIRDAGGELTDTQKQYNAQVSAIRAPVERAIANIKAWRVLHTDYRRPLASSSIRSAREIPCCGADLSHLKIIPGRCSGHVASGRCAGGCDR